MKLTQEFYTPPFKDRRPRSLYKIYVTLLQLRITVAFAAPRKPCFFGSRHSAVVSVSSKNRSAWPCSKGRAEAFKQPKRAVSSSAARVQFWSRWKRWRQERTARAAARPAGLRSGSTRL